MATPQASSVEIFPDTRGAQIIEDEATPDQRDSRDIYLPNHQESVSHIAVDVGGSLAKVVYFARARSNSESKSQVSDILSQPRPSTSTSTSASNISNPNSPRLFEADLSSSFYSHYSSDPFSSDPRPRTRTTSSDVGPLTPSGTLTPTTILNSTTSSLTNVYQPSSETSNNTANLSSISSSIHSTFFRRRSLPSSLPGGRLYFVKFETSNITSCISFLNTLITNSATSNGVSIEEMRKSVKLMATGGGAHLFYETFEKELGVSVQKEDEMSCLITGLNFFTLIPDEVFWYSDELVGKLHDPLPYVDGRKDSSSSSDSVTPISPTSEIPSSQPQPQLQSSQSEPQELPRPSPSPPLYNPLFDSHPSPKLPCLLVNIGSGVSIIKVDDFGKFERVSGTSLGGGTLWGLLSLLTEAESFDEMLSLSESGDNSTVDMLVGDIYGAVGLNHLGLKSSTIASSFGKVFKKNGPRKVEDRKRKFKSKDICRSLLYAISNNIGQIAYMNAEKYNLDRIYFGGCFIRGHKSTISTLSYAIRFWSRGTKRAFFLRHEGYLGAIGAWLRCVGGDEVGVPVAESSSPSKEEAKKPEAKSEPVKSASTSKASSPPTTTIPTPRVKTEPSHQLPSLLQEALGGSPLEGFSPHSKLNSTTSTSNNSVPQVRPQVNGHARTSEQNGIASERTLADLLASLSESDKGLLSPYLPSEVLSSTSTSNSTPMTTSSNLNSISSATTQTTRGESVEDQQEDEGLEADEEDLEMMDPNQLIQIDGETFSVKDLLAKMEMAEGAADGLEDKLDSLLGRLDGMLEGMGINGNDADESLRG